MRILLAIALSACVFSQAYSQKEVKDSLLIELAKHPTEDSARVDLLTKISYFSYDSRDDTRKYAEEGLALATKLGYRKGLATAHYTLAIYYQEGGEFNKALEETTTASRIYESIGNMKGVYNSTNQIANVYYHWKEYDEALMYFNKMLAMDSVHKNLGDKGQLFNNMGSLHALLEDYEKAMDYHQQTLAIWTKANSKYGMAVANCEIGQSLVKLKQFAKAKPYFTTSLKLIEEIGAGQNVAGAVHVGLAEINVDSKQFNIAEKEMNTALATYEKLKDANGLLEALKIASVLYEAKGDYKKALDYKAREKVLSDSIFSAEKARHIAEVGTKYKVDEKDQDIKQLESETKEQAGQLTFLLTILIIATLGFSIAFYLIYQKRKREKLLLDNLSREYEKIKNYRPHNGHSKVAITPSPVTLPSIDERFLQGAINSVEKNISNTLFGVDNLADDLAVSRTQLHRRLKDLAGLSTGEFIRYLRLKRAAMLLEKKADSITQIAYEVGFSDQSYFTKAFKKQFGKTPSEYTQQHQASVSEYKIGKDL